MRRVHVHGLSLTLLVFVLMGCGAAATPTPFPLPGRTAATTPEEIAVQAAHERLNALLGKAPEVTPMSLTWGWVLNGSLLERNQNTQFCQALDVPGSDDVLAGLLNLGINAFWERFRHRPAPEDLDTIVEHASSFAIKSCPAWVPIVRPTARSSFVPSLPWYPLGYSPVVGEPDLAWRWSLVNVRCSGPTPCWHVDVLSRRVCNGLHGEIAVYDATGSVVDFATADSSLLLARLPLMLAFTSIQPGPLKGRLAYLGCL